MSMTNETGRTNDKLHARDGGTGGGWKRDVSTWGQQRKAQLGGTEQSAVEETMRRLRGMRAERAEPANASAGREERRGWPVLSYPQLAGACALMAAAAILSVFWLIQGEIPTASTPSQLQLQQPVAQSHSHPKAPAPPRVPRIRIVYQVRCSVVTEAEAEAPRRPLLQVSRYEALF